MYRCGLVLADIGMRGVFTAGVLDVLLEENINCTSVFGVSTGCLNGINYISGQKGRSFYTFLNNHGSIFDNYHSGNTSAVLERGIMDGKDMPFMDSSAFDNNSYLSSPARLTAVLTDVQTGLPEYMQITNPDKERLVLNTANSLSPVTLMPTTINGKKYISGLTADSIPLKESILAGNIKNIVITTRAKEYFTNSCDNYDMAIVRYHKYPAMKSVLKNAYDNFLSKYDYLQEECKKGSTFVLAMPDDLMVTNTDNNRDALVQAYKCGRQVANDNLDKLLDFLNDCQQ